MGSRKPKPLAGDQGRARVTNSDVQAITTSVPQSPSVVNTQNRQRQAGPPELFNLDAETGILGGLLLNFPEVSAYPQVKALGAGDFWSAENRDVWAAIWRVERDGLLPDVISVGDRLAREGATIGAARLVQLVTECTSYARAGDYARIVANWSRQRAAEVAVSNLGACFGTDGRFDRTLDQTISELSALRSASVGPVEFTTMEQIRQFYGDIRWCWHGWLPIGHVSLIAGPQSVGKSYLAARLMASIAGCADWPDGTPCTDARHAILVETEGMRGAFAERLEAMGVQPHWVILPGDELYTADLVRDAARIEALARQEGAGAIFVDSLSGGHSMKEDGAEMRRLLTRYSAMAAGLQIPVVLVHHCRKRSELEPVNVTLDRVRGSTTITQFCRSVLALWRLDDGDPLGAVRVECIKANFCKPPEPLGFTIGDGGLEFGEAPEQERIETQLDKACDLLRALLATGPIPSTDLQDEADGAGISWDTMKRAKDRLHIVARRDGKERKWSWGLPVHV